MGPTLCLIGRSISFDAASVYVRRHTRPDNNPHPPRRRGILCDTLSEGPSSCGWGVWGGGGKGCSEAAAVAGAPGALTCTPWACVCDPAGGQRPCDIRPADDGAEIGQRWVSDRRIRSLPRRKSAATKTEAYYPRPRGLKAPPPPWGGNYTVENCVPTCSGEVRLTKSK